MSDMAAGVTGNPERPLRFGVGDEPTLHSFQMVADGGPLNRLVPALARQPGTLADIHD